MKRIFATVLLFVLAFASYAQKNSDILTLKNGSVIKGTFVNRDSGNVKIKTKDGSVFVYSADDIEKARNKKEARKDEQEELKKKRAALPKSLLVGFSACPTTSFGGFKKRTYSYAPLAFEQYAPKGGFIGGFSLSYSKGQVGFETGLIYSTNALGYSYREATSSPVYGITYYPSTGIPEQQYGRYHSLRLPLLFTVVSKGTKTRLYYSIGVSADLMLYAVSTDNYYGKVRYALGKGWNYNANTNTIPYYYPLLYSDEYMGAQTKLGVELNLTPTILLRVCPSLYYGLSSLYGGLDIQVMFNVKKNSK